MGRCSTAVDDPVSPSARFFLRPEMDYMVYCISTLQNPLDLPSLKSHFRETFLFHNPRFASLQVTDARGRKTWRPSPNLNLDDHIVVVGDDEDDGTDDNFVDDYVSSLAVSSPLPRDKPLWDVHIMPRRRTCLFRLHHAISDGTALMSLFLASCERADDPTAEITLPGSRRPDNERLSLPELLWRLLKVAFFTVIFVWDFLLHAAWVRDEPNPISGGAGVELWPRKLCSVSFDLEDIKTVKNKTNATINDVIIGIVTCGLEKYFKMKCTKGEKTVRVSGLAMVDVRKTPGLQDFLLKIKKGTAEWGNRIGFVILPINLRLSGNRSLEHVRQAKAIIDQKKQSLEAKLSHLGAYLTTFLLGEKVTTMLNYRVLCNTSFTISNIIGPSEMIMFAKNPILSIRVTSSSLPQALVCHLVSYNGKVALQLLVAKDIISEPERLAKFFRDSLNEMLLEQY